MAAGGQEELQMSDPFVIFDFYEKPPIGPLIEIRQNIMPAIRLPINFPPFKQLSYDDCTYLSSPALDQLVPNTEDSKLLKSKLWVCLKTIFDV